ncbi:hypothetical protein [Microvirga splendida]|uniref:Uncharacterized protein n=1 Tax=Microvirga splendida TaxID=2795727 RepID=A0ABS0XV80_9HYPH|nr:hypothetical protein [Microvirga splendida]MBJ6123951.1 hypothetical protein [Microvirga splendida]
MFLGIMRAAQALVLNAMRRFADAAALQIATLMLLGCAVLSEIQSIRPSSLPGVNSIAGNVDLFFPNVTDEVEEARGSTDQFFVLKSRSNDQVRPLSLDNRQSDGVDEAYWGHCHDDDDFADCRLHAAHARQVSPGFPLLSRKSTFSSHA